jgi:hypothetical protein
MRRIPFKRTNKGGTMLKKLYTVKDVAYYLRRSESAIRMLVYRGHLTSLGHGKHLFEEEEIQRFLKDKSKKKITKQEISDLAGRDYIEDKIKKYRKRVAKRSPR